MVPVKWLMLWFVVFLSVPVAALFNYLVDPYGLYKTKIFDLEKTQQSNKIRLVKAASVKDMRPASIILGTSRAEFGFNPEHDYFAKPSYNLAIAASTIYESKLSLFLAMQQGNLKQVVLVADYRMFSSTNMNSSPDFSVYFNNDNNVNKYLFSLDVLVDSLKTIAGTSGYYDVFLDNGQREHDHHQRYVIENGGYAALMSRDESVYYRGFKPGYLYRDTKKNAFDDFEEIIQLCYENDIALDVVFGPSHVRQWEALDRYLDYEEWLNWKRDIVLSMAKVSAGYHRPPYRVFDFSVYHDLTSEEVPEDRDDIMRYYWESSHYKSELGDIVLDRLAGLSDYNDFGYELTEMNIEIHLQRQRDNRKLFMTMK